MLAAIGPQMQKFLRWKKYLTVLQMIQFVMIFVHAIQLYFYNPCEFPLLYANVIMMVAVLFLVLFKGQFVFSLSIIKIKAELLFSSFLREILCSNEEQKHRESIFRSNVLSKCQ
jgi:hypothetical protein